MSQQTSSKRTLEFPKNSGEVPKELEGTVFEILLKEHKKVLNPEVPPKCIWKQAREAKEFLESRGFH
jgi:hypothetical protein